MSEPDDNQPAGLRFRVTGRVQGVGFRAFTQRSAFRLGVQGWCRNTTDGAVEGEAFATPDALTAFLALLDQGPPASRVQRLVAVDAEVGPFDGFEVRR